jgi:hypothetical protein
VTSLALAERSPDSLVMIAQGEQTLERVQTADPPPRFYFIRGLSLLARRSYWGMAISMAGSMPSNVVNASIASTSATRSMSGTHRAGAQTIGVVPLTRGLETFPSPWANSLLEPKTAATHESGQPAESFSPDPTFLSRSIPRG